MEPEPSTFETLRGLSAERVWLQVEPAGATSFDELLLAAGLRPLGERWVEVDRAQAREFLTAILVADLAYRAPRSSLEEAVRLANEFLAHFEGPAIYGVNSEGLPGEYPFGWEPATDYTFDAGVVVIGSVGSGLIWIADED